MERAWIGRDRRTVENAGMRKGPLALLILACVVVAFLAGTWVAHWGASKRPAGGKKVLYYVDPMHPAYKSDKPGIAPDCGMQLEPVYEDGSAAGGGSSPSIPGTVTLSAEKQQAFGVAVRTVEKVPWTATARILGKVAADEARTYRITAATEIWVRKAFPPTTGSFVRKDEPLAAYYTGGFLAAANAYMYALDTRRRHSQTADVSQAQAQNLDFQMRQAVGNLINMGVSQSQIREMENTGKVSEFVEIRSPSDGFILVRGVSEGQFVPVGSELYRIADLGKVWVLADLFEHESRFVRAGQTVKVLYQGRTYDARVGKILPQFDPVSRTFKVRLEMDNPEYVFRPDMFVDVELPINLPDSLTAPASAVIDTGSRRTVFVDRGNGYFEPRRVETGWRFGDRIEITKGLMEGERIVVSGNFLVDSESRMRLAAAGLPEDYVLDPVCGMGVDPKKAGERKSTYKGRTYYFCNPDCRTKFDSAPRKYIQEEAEAESPMPPRETQQTPGRDPEKAEGRPVTARDLVCGMDVDVNAPGILKVNYQGKTYYFCNPSCKESFLNNPAKYLPK